jgi:signal transduction histidine kinase
VGAVRVTQSVAAVRRAVRNIELGIAVIALIVLALGMSAGALIAAQVARPLRRLEEVARRFAAGDLRAKAEIEGSREQRSLGRSFNEMTDRIARLLGVQRDFVADASHQLRTPLTGLRLRLEEARAVAGNPEATAEIDAAIAEADRLGHTIEELLVLSRADEREVVFERFHRGRAGRTGPPGNGLGLAIARELAREWHGDVRLEDRDGGGAVAVVALPDRSQ